MRKKPSKRLVQNSSSANSSPSSVRLPVSRCRKISLKAKSLNVSTIQHEKERDRLTRKCQNLTTQWGSDVPAENFAVKFPFKTGSPGMSLWSFRHKRLGAECWEEYVESPCVHHGWSHRLVCSCQNHRVPCYPSPSIVLCSWPYPPPCTPQTP